MLTLHFLRIMQILIRKEFLNFFLQKFVASVGSKILYFVLIFRPEQTENLNAPKDTAIKPAKLSRGRAPKPLLQLGRKWGKKPPPPSTKASDASDKMDTTVNDETTEEQVINNAVSKYPQTFYTSSLWFTEKFTVL